MQTEYNGSMGLLEVKRVTERIMGLNTVYCIKFKEDSRMIIATKLHAFMTDTSNAKKISELISGDKIWVETNQLYNKKS